VGKMLIFLMLQQVVYTNIYRCVPSVHGSDLQLLLNYTSLRRSYRSRSWH